MRWHRGWDGGNYWLNGSCSTKSADGASVTLSRTGDAWTEFGTVAVAFRWSEEAGFEEEPLTHDPDHPHAVSSVTRPDGTDTYGYDASGSQTSRTEAGQAYTQTVNGEGQLVGVQNTTSGETWTFVYDGDGQRVRQTNPDGTSTLFLFGGLYEVSLDAGGAQTAVKRYYAIGGSAIALRDQAGTFYLLGDRQGSILAVIDGTGAVVAEQRYRPFGQPRLTPGITQTNRGFTGQENLAGAGLQDFNARWFDVSLGGFASPDSLIPNTYDPQSLNRYAYVLNNPLRYTDPTGHRECDDQWGCEGPPPPRPTPPPQYDSLFSLPEDLTPAQTDALRETATQAVELESEFLASLVGGPPEDAFEAVLGSFTVAIDPTIDVVGTCITEIDLVTCEELPPLQTLLHELSHIFDVRYRTLSGGSYLASDLLPPLVVGDTEVRYTSDGPVRTEWGYICDHTPCQASQVDSLSEEFADTYMNYILDPLDFPQNGFTEDDYGQARRDEFLHFMRYRWLPEMGFEVIPE